MLFSFLSFVTTRVCAPDNSRQIYLLPVACSVNIINDVIIAMSIEQQQQLEGCIDDERQFERVMRP